MNNTTFVFGMLIGAVLQYAIPRAWKQASEADRLEMSRGRRAPVWRRTWRDRLRALARWGWR